jgi:hypothetical protein
MQVYYINVYSNYDSITKQSTLDACLHESLQDAIAFAGDNIVQYQCTHTNTGEILELHSQAAEYNKSA